MGKDELAIMSPPHFVEDASRGKSKRTRDAHAEDPSQMLCQGRRGRDIEGLRYEEKV